MNGRFAQVAIVLSIFIWSYIFFKAPFEGYFAYIVIFIFLPFYLIRYPFPKGALLIFLPTVIAGFLSIQNGDNESGFFIKIFVGFFLSVVFYKYVFDAFDHNVEQLYKLYLTGAYIATIIGIIQLVSYNVGFEPGYNYRWVFNKWGLSRGGIGLRMNSIFSEPSYFAATIAPAFFTSIHNLITGKHRFITRRQAIIIAVAYPLAFSTLGIIAMFICALLMLVNFGFFRYALVVGPLMIGGYQYAYENIPEFRERIDGTTTVFTDEDMQDINLVHGSSFVLYNNYVITMENFKRNPFFGTGLGSHPVAFDKYSLTNQAGVLKIDFNKADANSMFLRLLSETGLYGVTVMLVFLLRNFTSRQRSANDTNWLISNSVLTVILVYLARQGHYFFNGLPFFIWMYYYVKKQNNAQLAALNEKEDAEYAEARENALAGDPTLGQAS